MCLFCSLFHITNMILRNCLYFTRLRLKSSHWYAFSERFFWFYTTCRNSYSRENPIESVVCPPRRLNGPGSDPDQHFFKIQISISVLHSHQQRSLILLELATHLLDQQFTCSIRENHLKGNGFILTFKEVTCNTAAPWPLKNLKTEMRLDWLVYLFRNLYS